MSKIPTFQEFLAEEKQPYSQWMIDAAFKDPRETLALKFLVALYKILY